MSCWRSCCGNFWGSSNSTSELQSHRTLASKSSASTQPWEEEPVEVEAVESPPEKPNFQPHSEANAELLSKKWITHVQKRAAKVWERDEVLSLLKTVALSVSFTDDPILGDPSPSAPCVLWHGDTSMEQGLPVIQVQKRGQDKTVPSYVCKLLSFLFADDDSLKMLKQIAPGQVSMNCGNSQCIRLSHFVGYTPKWAAKYQPQAKAKAKTPAKAKGKATPQRA
ncbi:hypothetical protein, conserved [Eimeria tenella]|uniref:Uncharacterized protein n=1 Tax=Eimeria tenella TaxID=5802 RepID=U6L815_EIMTE|nr:hypothetical protein, conserved [Eimeria tenella]CDJ45353.1 hypothetical protein, conserved [Eimeria tenella]|eukprot:XP_013236099.1 hypothetical protein, conserved [Eimeria tenella]